MSLAPTFAHWLDALPLPVTPARPQPFNWSTVDWSLDNRTIAQKTGYAYMTVAVKRPRPANGRAPSQSKWASYDWASLDWSQTNNELARRTGMDINTVRNYRIKLGFPRASAPRNGTKIKVTPEMLEGADWLYKRDIDLAHEWGCSRERIRQLRQQHSKPQCRGKNLPPKLLACLRWIDQNRASIEGQHVSDVVTRMPEASRQIRIRALRKANVKLHYLFSNPQCHPHFRIVNWALPNIVIAMIWTTIKGKNAVANARVRWHFGPPKWSVQCFDTITDDLVVAARAEMARAKEHGVTPNEDAFDKWLAFRANLAGGRMHTPDPLRSAGTADPTAP